MPTMTAALAALLGLSVSGATPGATPPADVAIGVVHVELQDAARADPLSTSRRRWRVDLYYPASTGNCAPEPYASDAALLAWMTGHGYYDVAPEVLASWSSQPGPACPGAHATSAPLPLLTLSPGSGVAAFNYSELAAAIARRGYAVAVVDHPYLGLSHLSDGRILAPTDDPVQQVDDPTAWQPRVIEWARDISLTLDRLPRLAAVRRVGVHLDLQRVLAVGHSLGGAVAVETCSQDLRVSACADFEGVVEGTTAYVQGPRRPTLFTLSRSAKPERPFLSPDLAQAPWNFLGRGALDSNWGVAISGGSHMSFSDAPGRMPATLSRFGGTLMSAQRSMQVYAGIVDALATAYFPGGGGNPAMQAFFRDVPEAKAVHSGHQDPGSENPAQSRLPRSQPN